MSENVALREAIEKKVTVQEQVGRETEEFLDQLHTEESSDLTQRDGDGWRVQFANGAPSFYFSPFTREEFDNVFKDNDVTYAERHPCTATVGKILGWTVDYAPLVRNKAGTFFVAHARFTRRLRCNLDDSYRILPNLDKNVWPVLVTPRSWGCSQTGSSWNQLLQSFDENAVVLVGNIRVTLIYGTLLPHDTHENGDRMVNRMDKYIMTIADSAANLRNRQAEGEQEDVQWVLQGGTYMTVTEVDASTIDVVFDQRAESLSEMHGRELYVDWIQFPGAVRLSDNTAKLVTAQ